MEKLLREIVQKLQIQLWDFLIIFAVKFAANCKISGKIKLFVAQYINQTLHFYCFCIEVDFAQKVWFRLGIQVNYHKRSRKVNFRQVGKTRLKIFQGDPYYMKNHRGMFFWIKAVSPLLRQSIGSLCTSTQLCCVSIFKNSIFS